MPTSDLIPLHDGRLLQVHPHDQCTGRVCPIHAPSSHSLDHAPFSWRDDRAFMERVCPHGVGHPDPDGLTYYATTHTARETAARSSHGCDGCCSRQETP